MNSLPVDILALVLQHVPLSPSKISLQAVCRKWRDAMLLPKAHCRTHNEHDDKAYDNISSTLLSLLPLGHSQRRLQAQGLCLIQDLETRYVEEWPAAFTGVTKVWFDDLSKAVHLTPQRFPAVEHLTIQDKIGTPIERLPSSLSLSGFERLRCLSLGLVDWGKPIPRVCGVPDDCDIDATIDTKSLQDLVDELKLAGLAVYVKRLYIGLFWSPDLGDISLAPLAELSRLVKMHVRICRPDIEIGVVVPMPDDMHTYVICGFDGLASLDLNFGIDSVTESRILFQLSHGWQHTCRHDIHTVSRLQR